MGRKIVEGCRTRNFAISEQPMSAYEIWKTEDKNPKIAPQQSPNTF